MYFVKIFLNSPLGGLEARGALRLLNLKIITSRVYAEHCFRNILLYLSICVGVFFHTSWTKQLEVRKRNKTSRSPAVYGHVFMSVTMLMIYCNNKSHKPHRSHNLLQQCISRGRPPEPSYRHELASLLLSTSFI